MEAIEHEEGNAVTAPINAETTKLSRTKRARISADKPIADCDYPALMQSLMRLDPILQFLTKATGKPLVPLTMLQGAIPSDPSQHQQMLKDILELADRGVLQVHGDTTKIGMPGADINEISVGFPPPPSMEQAPEIQQLTKTIGTLHASTKTAAKRRLAALKRSLKHIPYPRALKDSAATPKSRGEDHIILTAPDVHAPSRTLNASTIEDGQDSEQDEHCLVLKEEKDAIEALCAMFKFKVGYKNNFEEVKVTKHSLDCVLPKQASYAGSNSARSSSYGKMSETILDKFPAALVDAFALERPGPSGTNNGNHRKLYTHQVVAIESAMDNRHTLVCTGTGSGKSLCFLIPVLAAAMAGRKSILMFPTKALAQDQLSKLKNMLTSNPGLQNGVKPGIIDGDVSHADRSDVAKTCNIILTNPDTLHAAILPNWKGPYKELLGNVKYIVIDEAHMYDGVFGAHVAMVLSRMIRLCAVCTGNSDTAKTPTFLACSATMSHPEEHFRLICPVASTEPVTVLAPSDDGSPRASKHFFVWNPPIMNANGATTGRVTVPYPKKTNGPVVANQTVAPRAPSSAKFCDFDGIALSSDDRADDDLVISSNLTGTVDSKPFRDGMQLYRRHSADETALLLARAVANNVRCIAFCKTRNLVEWVYERTIQALKSDPETAKLVNKVESYRGGYIAESRRAIEQRLFKGELTGVVGTSALELGVDIGGIDLTLHCGYPTSFASLLQQAGRAGRGAANLHVPSLAIMVSFNSPAEQHLWRHPENLLTRGLTLPISMPINVGLVRGHLLCAGSEYPLTGKFAVTRLFETRSCKDSIVVLNDYELFGSQEIFEGALAVLKSTGLMKEENCQVASGEYSSMATFKTHPFVEKPWTKVSLRSIEPINYKIVDLSHPLQGSQMDGIKDERAVMDTIPYSRVFYHAFPGAVIMHRGRKYKVQSMTRPPAFADSCCGYRGGSNLAAYAKPTTARYSTRPLSTMKITVVKQMERLDDQDPHLINRSDCNDRRLAHQPVLPYTEEVIQGSLGGNGVVTVCRNVHGFTKLSPVTRVEISRTELSMPPMEFDTFAFWIDTEATALSQVVKDYDDGVHALNHALLAVAPLFAPCTSADINCDHSRFGCSRIMIFDMRAGGAGTSAQLWKSLFRPHGLLEAAIDLLANCPSCLRDQDSTGYQGGCPACLQSGQCLNFNLNLSRHSALIIAKRMLNRIQATELYIKNIADIEAGLSNGVSQILTRSKEPSEWHSPRRAAREKAMCEAKDLRSARERQVVVGRPSWPLDNSNGVGGRQIDGD